MTEPLTPKREADIRSIVLGADMSPPQKKRLQDLLAALDRERAEHAETRQSQPAWHDKPTGPGLWVLCSGRAHEATKVFERDGVLHMLSRLCPVSDYGYCQWYGPIPEPPATVEDAEAAMRKHNLEQHGYE